MTSKDRNRNQKPAPRGARLDHNGRPWMEPDGFMPELDAIGAVYADVLRTQIRHDPADVLFRSDAVKEAVAWASDALVPRLNRVLEAVARREIDAARELAAEAVVAAGEGA